MKVPLKTKASKSATEKFEPDDVQKAIIMLEATVNDDYRRMADVLKAIHDTADDRGKRIKHYLDEAKSFYRDMKEMM